MKKHYFRFESEEGFEVALETFLRGTSLDQERACLRRPEGDLTFLAIGVVVVEVDDHDKSLVAMVDDCGGEEVFV